MSTEKKQRDKTNRANTSRTVYALVKRLPYGSSVIAHAKTDSMTPTIRVGQQVRITRVPVDTIRKNDIIAYVRPDKKGILVHRVIEKRIAPSGVQFVTKGDRLDRRDPYTTHPRHVLGKARPITEPSAWGTRIVVIGLFLLCFELLFQLVDVSRYFVAIGNAKRQAQDWYATDARSAWTSTVDAKLTSRYHPFLGWTYNGMQTPYVNTEPDMARRTIGNPKDGTFPVIWFFGGSTTWGIYARDEETIPSRVSQLLNKNKPRATVVNYGHISYNSNQELMYLLLLLKEGKRPDIVVFYDGCNDLRTSPELVRNEQTVRDMLGDMNAIVFPKAALAYRTLPDLLNDWRRSIVDRVKIFQYSRQIFSPIIKRLRNLPVQNVPLPPTDAEIAEHTVENYRKNANVIDALSRGYGFRYLLLWQPTIYGKPLTEEELRFPKTDPVMRSAHDLANRRFAQTPIPHFIDMTTIFKKEADTPIFTDECHVIPEANSTVARHIAEALQPLFNEY